MSGDFHSIPGVCFAVKGRITPDRSAIEIYSSNENDPSFFKKTIHISCKSDAYCGASHNYGGIIIFGCDGKSDWYTANGTHCKTGYLVIKDTDCHRPKPQEKFPNEPGQVHGAIYRMVFGESFTERKVVGEGFAIMNGEFKENSGVFNCARDNYHDSSKGMNAEIRKCVEKVVECWKATGCSCQNYYVKDLLD